MIPIGRWENSGFRQQINVRRDALRCAAPRYASTLRTAEQRFRIAPDTARGGGVVHRIQVDAVHVVGHEVGDLLGSVEDAGGTQGLDVVPPLVQQGVEPVRDARGVALFLTDLFMVVAACFVFNLYTALYSFVGLTVKSLVIDAVLERIKMCKAILIICDDKDPICNFVMRKLVRGATYTPCFGAYTDKPHYMIYTTLTNREAGQLQEFIHKENLNAFISMLSTTEVFGKGFNHA